MLAMHPGVSYSFASLARKCLLVCGNHPNTRFMSENIRANLTDSDRRQIENCHAARALVLDHSGPEKGLLWNVVWCCRL